MVDISNRGIVGFNGESGRDTKDDIICQSKKKWSAFHCDGTPYNLFMVSYCKI